MVAVSILARRFHGAWAGLFAVAALLGASRTMSFGGKVMVETFLSLWILLALALASFLLAYPSRKLGVALGLTTGLAFLTKSTAGLLLLGALVAFFWRVLANESDRTSRLRALGWATLTCLAVSAPWYVHNGVSAFQFAVYSSQYNLVAEGQASVPSVGNRLIRILADLPGGWPLLAPLAIWGCSMFRGATRTTWPRALALHSPHTGPPLAGGDSPTVHFRKLTVVATITATAILMVPPYFDTRFLLPVWPALAVVLGGGLATGFAKLTRGLRFVYGAALASSVLFSAIRLVSEPVSTTCWNASTLIDQLAGRLGVSNLANVGNIEGWNVCKTGLINELRKNPDDCFVLHDLSAETPEGLKSRLRRFDAVAVLDPSAFPPGYLTAAPGLNRAYPIITAIVQADPELARVEGLPREGLPPMVIYRRHLHHEPLIRESLVAGRATTPDERRRLSSLATRN
jgi:hypothetical protein